MTAQQRTDMELGAAIRELRKRYPGRDFDITYRAGRGWTVAVYFFGGEYTPTLASGQLRRLVTALRRVIGAGRRGAR